MNKRIAIIRIRGKQKMKSEVSDTLKMLRLYKQNGCVVVPSKATYLGMINKAKDYITWGEIDEETFKELITKRGRIAGNKLLTEEYMKENAKMGMDEFVKEFFAFKKELKDVPGFKCFFKLTPPSKGFGRKGIKKPFSMGGALGYRMNKINDLIKRMI
ncbi:50S ribosomal protein L30 [archaeon]|jgi:large subunit ribosomal protein L30|nr:50S ribosomal protein L30 [archaeon]MBT4416760.1 50S ribosomal protein L30 [archaeon]